MLHVQRIGLVHRPTGHVPGSPPDNLLATVVLVAEALVLVGELVLLFGPALLDPPWIPAPTVLPDPRYPRSYA